MNWVAKVNTKNVLVILALMISISNLSPSSSAQSQMEQAMAADPFAKGDSVSQGGNPGMDDFIFNNRQR